MNLKQYLTSKNIKVVDFAKKVGCHNITISAYMNKRIRISKYLAYRIESATNGELSAIDLMDFNTCETGAQKLKLKNLK